MSSSFDPKAHALLVGDLLGLTQGSNGLGELNFRPERFQELYDAVSRHRTPLPPLRSSGRATRALTIFFALQTSIMTENTSTPEKWNAFKVSSFLSPKKSSRSSRQYCRAKWQTRFVALYLPSLVKLLSSNPLATFNTAHPHLAIVAISLFRLVINSPLGFRFARERPVEIAALGANLPLMILACSDQIDVVSHPHSSYTLIDRKKMVLTSLVCPLSLPTPAPLWAQARSNLFDLLDLLTQLLCLHTLLWQLDLSCKDTPDAINDYPVNHRIVEQLQARYPRMRTYAQDTLFDRTEYLRALRCFQPGGVVGLAKTLKGKRYIDQISGAVGYTPWRSCEATHPGEEPTRSATDRQCDEVAKVDLQCCGRVRLRFAPRSDTSSWLTELTDSACSALYAPGSVSVGPVLLGTWVSFSTRSS